MHLIHPDRFRNVHIPLIIIIIIIIIKWEYLLKTI